MKKCDNCNIEMIENTNLHTDYVGGVKFEEQVFLEKENDVTKRIKARVCPNCGKVELFVDLEND